MTRPLTRQLPDDPMLRRLIGMARESTMSRRLVLAAGTAAAATLALAACAADGTAVNGPKVLTPAQDDSATDRTMTWANWALYLDEDSSRHYPTLETFEAQTGIHVTYDPIVDDNNSYYAKVRNRLALGQDIGADTVCLTDWMASRWIDLGYTQRLDLSQIPNAKNLHPALQSPDFDPGRQHSLPWQSGFAGIAWNNDKLPNGLEQVSDLWDASLKGKVGVLSEMRDTIGLIMLEQGTDVSSATWGDKEFDAALTEFRKHVESGQIRTIKGNSYVDDLKSGKTWAAIAWSGDIEGLNTEVGSQKFGFTLPQTGGTLWSDNFLIPIGSSKKSNVEKLIDYYYDPTVAATVAAYVNFITPVEGAKEAMATIDPDLVDEQLIFPNPDTLSLAHIFRTLTSAEQARYNTAFEAVALGA